MAIKTEHKPLSAGKPNAMIIEIVRTGAVWLFQLNGTTLILLSAPPSSVLDISPRLAIGHVPTYIPIPEYQELAHILFEDGDSYMLETVTETVRVVARFCI